MIAPPSVARARTIWSRHRERVGVGIVAGLVVLIEIALILSYVRGTETTQDFTSSSTLVTTVASAQRETLRLHVEIDRLALDGVGEWRTVDQQAAILRSMLRTVGAAARGRPDIQEQLAEIGADVDAVSDRLPELDGAAAGTTLVLLDSLMRDLEVKVKRLYDDLEIAYFASMSDTLGATADTQFVMVVVAIAVVIVAIAFGLGIRRRIRGEFARAYRQLETEMGERERVQRALRHQAYHDALTGAPNRTLFLERLGQAVEGATGDLSVLFVDLDDFKTINDSLGHAAGDQLLTSVVERIRACLRSGDTVARMGGDEFAILIPGDALGAAPEDVARRVIAAVRRPFALADGSVVSASATVGIASARLGEVVSAEELLRNADLAMYAAKANGKDRFEIYASVMHDAARRRLSQRGELERALAADEFAIQYQPIVDLEDGAVAGVEALIRWAHPERGLIAPGEFIGTAEETGLIVPIGRWVLEQACGQVARWQRDGIAGPTFSLSVNLSPRQLRDEDLVSDVARALHRSGLPPACLTLEMTETLLVDEIDAAADTLGRLKALGVQLAIDDFGTGYSSISYLARLPIDVLKLDRSFVVAAADAADPGTRLARTILGLGRSVGLPAVAEGIELPEQVRTVRELGCRYGQGYLFARPADAAATAAILGQPMFVPEPLPRPRQSSEPRSIVPLTA